MFFYLKARAGWLVARAASDLYVTSYEWSASAPPLAKCGPPFPNMQRMIFFLKKNHYSHLISNPELPVFSPPENDGQIWISLRHVAFAPLKSIIYFKCLGCFFCARLSTAEFRPGSRKRSQNLKKTLFFSLDDWSGKLISVHDISHIGIRRGGNIPLFPPHLWGLWMLIHPAVSSQ